MNILPELQSNIVVSLSKWNFNY